jgi:hypothetical protein
MGGGMNRAWGNASDQILLHVKEFGPCTASEILACIELNPNNVRQILHRLGGLVKRGPMAGQRRIHIKGWVHDSEGQRDYPRPLWAYGHGTHAKKPTPKAHIDVQRARYQRIKTRLTGANIFGVRT